MTIRLRLHEEHFARGGHMGMRSGWELPDHYGDPVEEHRAVRRNVGLIDQSFRGKLSLRGKDRIEFLQGMVTNDVQRLTPGQGCYAAITTNKAKMLSDCRIYCLPEALFLDFEPEVVEKIHQHLDRYIIASDVSMTNLTETWGALSLFGPKAPDILKRALGLTDLPTIECASIETPFESGHLLIARNDITGEAGYDLEMPADSLSSVFETLTKAEVPLIGQAAFNSLRIEAGVPRYGIDMDESHFPMEAGITQRAISETKGCYIGQETIARAMAQGRMNRYLVGLEIKGDAVPSKGQRIKKDDKTLGSITSGTQSPSLGKIIALGYVLRDFAKPGTDVWVETGAPSQTATITTLPFYQHAG